MSRRIEDLHPSLQPIVREIIRRANERGLFPFIMEGTRLPEYQACLYAQGRLAVGHTAVFSGFKVKAEYSVSRKYVVVTCGAASNLVAPDEWGRTVTQVGPFGSWHTLRLAVDFGFHSSATATDHLVGDLEGAAERVKDKAEASRLRRQIDNLYARLANIINEVCPAIIWGEDWDDDGILNGPDPDNEWSDPPHFEWHPGVKSIRLLSSSQRADILVGRFPPAPVQCHVCKAFAEIAADDICRTCHEQLHAPAPARVTDGPCVGIK